MATRTAFVLATLATLSFMNTPAANAKPDARVTGVRVSGSAGAYTFIVTLASNDTGCSHYADWWEVVDEHHGLVYRRVLLHDHADEQPFTRDGGPVNIAADQTVVVRAHMNTSGYSRAAMRGTPAKGFTPVELPSGYAAELARKPPLPDGC